MGTPAPVKVDYAHIVPLLQASAAASGTKLDAGGALRFFLEHQDSILKFFGWVGGQIKGRSKDKAAAAPAPPATITIEIPTKQPPVAPPGVVTGVIATGTALVKQLRGVHSDGFRFLEEWVDDVPGSGALSDRPRFEAVVAGDAVGRGAKLHADYSPFDADGKEIGPGDPRHEMVNGGAPYIEYQARINDQEQAWIDGVSAAAWGPFEIHQMDKNFGCTFFIKVPLDFSGSVTLAWRARVKGTDVTSQWSPTLNVS